MDGLRNAVRLVPLAPIDYRFEGEEDAPEEDEKSKERLLFSIAEIGVGTLMVALALGAFTLMLLEIPAAV